MASGTTAKKRYQFKKRHVFYALLLILAVFIVIRFVPFGRHDLLPDKSSNAAAQAGKLPLDPTSPWPKFRANALENGRSPVTPLMDPMDKPWTFQTGKGIFSSPVVDAEGTVYVGSADHVFYAIRRNGSLKWKIETGEIIDSSALLDDRGRVYFGSGDQQVYCADRETGAIVWKFKAHSVAEVQKEFKIKTYNVAWFEGNVGMLPDGSLLAPNDNYLVYDIDRDSGKRKTQYIGDEMVWSLPAVNARTGRLFFGTDYMALKNVYCYDIASGKLRWTAGGLGTVAATPLLTSEKQNGALILGAFDGYVRAFAQDSGKQLWKFGARDHIYASPAQLSDGTIIQPSADGTVYAIDPRTGRQKWAFDTLEPIRSSPAIDGLDRIYVGSGEGKLFCINPDGSLGWSYRCITEDRNDLNASPALGATGVYIAGESGGVFYVPYAYPQSDAGRKDPRVSLGPGEDLPSDGALLLYTTHFGALRAAPDSLDANEPVTLSLFVRKNGDTQLAAIDRDSIKVTVTGNPAVKLSVAANRSFLTLVPEGYWTGPEGGKITIDVSGSYSTRLSRFGLKFFGGKKGGDVHASLGVTIPPRPSSPLPYLMPTNQDRRQTVFEFSRLAAPNPTMLPSWNQIGFDSLHYLAGTVAPVAARDGKGGMSTLVWVIGGRAPSGAAVVDPSLEVRYPLVLDFDGGLVTLYNYDGFKINFVGSWDMPFGFYRLAARADPATGAIQSSAAFNAVALCDQIAFYGPGLKLMGMSEFDTGRMTVSGGLRLSVQPPKAAPPQGAIEATFEAGKAEASVRLTPGKPEGSAALDATLLKKDAHVFSLLLVDEASGSPLPLYYTKRTHVEADASGNVTRISVSWDKGQVKGKVRAYLMLDTYPVASGTLEIEP